MEGIHVYQWSLMLGEQATAPGSFALPGHSKAIVYAITSLLSEIIMGGKIVCEYRGASRLLVGDLEQSLRVCIEKKNIKLPHSVYVCYLEAIGEISSPTPCSECCSEIENNSSTVSCNDSEYDEAGSVTSYDSSNDGGNDIALSCTIDIPEDAEAKCILTMIQVSNWTQQACNILNLDSYTTEQFLMEAKNQTHCDKPSSEELLENPLCLWLGRMLEKAILESWESLDHNCLLQCTIPDLKPCHTYDAGEVIPHGKLELPNDYPLVSFQVANRIAFTLESLSTNPGVSIAAKALRHEQEQQLQMIVALQTLAENLHPGEEQFKFEDPSASKYQPESGNINFQAPSASASQLTAIPSNSTASSTRKHDTELLHSNRDDTIRRVIELLLPLVGSGTPSPAGKLPYLSSSCTTNTTAENTDSSNISIGTDNSMDVNIVLASAAGATALTSTATPLRSATSVPSVNLSSPLVHCGLLSSRRNRGTESGTNACVDIGILGQSDVDLDEMSTASTSICNNSLSHEHDKRKRCLSLEADDSSYSLMTNDKDLSFSLRRGSTCLLKESDSVIETMGGATKCSKSSENILNISNICSGGMNGTLSIRSSISSLSDTSELQIDANPFAPLASVDPNCTTTSTIYSNPSVKGNVDCIPLDIPSNSCIGSEGSDSITVRNKRSCTLIAVETEGFIAAATKPEELETSDTFLSAASGTHYVGSNGSTE